MSVQSYLVSGMTCDHCIAAVRDELQAVPGVSDVRVDLVPGAISTVIVESDQPLQESTVSAAVDEAGYRLVGER